MEPASGKKRPGKARNSCEACRSVKQRCDGATRYPCRRCEIYGIECAYEGGAPPSTAVHRHASGSGSQPPVSPIFIAPPSLDAAPTPSMAAAMMSMAASLRTINERLQLIESRMGPEMPGSTRVLRPESTASASPLNRDQASESDHLSPDSALDLGDGSNPVQMVVEEMSRIEARAGEMSLLDQAGARKVANPCDALLRGLVTVSEVELAFNFFIERIQPWTDTLARQGDRRPLVLRAKSPFLFSVILLVTNYYNTSKTDRANEVYRGLTEVVKLLLGASVLSPTANELNLEFVIALILLIHYKPVQHVTFYARGIYDLGKIVHASKVNPFSSMMIHGLMHRTASFLGLPSSPQAYLSAVASPGPVPLETTTSLRVWYWLCISDIHGSLQSGRPCQTDPTSALHTTRHFAEAKCLPTDPRRAATLEGYAISRTPVDALSTSKIRLSNLARMADDFDRWEQYWPAVLEHAQRNGDSLAYTALTTFQFVTLSTMSTVFTRWANERKKSLDEGGSGRPVLSTGDWSALQRAADACQKMIFSVSVEATQGGSSIRAGMWPGSPHQAHREPLTIDLRVVHDYTTGLDTVTCVAFVYALLLLVKMASAGLIGCDLQCLRQEYEAGADLDVPQGLAPGLKLPRLLLLGSQFLKGISPQPEHPAYKHGELIEMILEAGLGADTPHNASPEATVVMPSSAHMTIPVNVELNAPSAPLGPSVESWLDALSGTTRPPRPTSTTTADSNGTAPGEAMRILLDDISTPYHAPLQSGEPYFESLDAFGLLDNGMLVDWGAHTATPDWAVQ